MSSKLIVESKNDMLFVQLLIEHLNFQDIEVDIPICQPDDYECMEGLNAKKLEETLNIMKKKLIKEQFDKIGIIIDQDKENKEDRLNFINEAVKNVFATDALIEDTNSFIKASAQIEDDIFDLNIACFLTNVNGKGELETVLKAIKAENSTHADCLESWRECLKTNKKKISDKDFDKFWVSNYIRYDTCSKKERKRAGTKCSMSRFEYVMNYKKDIWNLDHSVLDNFKQFLELFTY